MPKTEATTARLQFGVKNYVLLGSAVLALALGYATLATGSTVVAPILLVVGYCVLFPVGLAL